MVDLYRHEEVGPKADVWALGCVLYALCFHVHPFAEESSLQILNAKCALGEARLPVRRSVPPTARTQLFPRPDTCTCT